MDGVSATRLMRALDRKDSGSVPIIAMTANAYDTDIKKCMDAGMNGHLAKPVSPEKMYQKIAKEIAKENRHGNHVL